MCGSSQIVLRVAGNPPRSQHTPGNSDTNTRRRRQRCVGKQVIVCGRQVSSICPRVMPGFSDTCDVRWHHAQLHFERRSLPPPDGDAPAVNRPGGGVPGRLCLPSLHTNGSQKMLFGFPRRRCCTCQPSQGDADSREPLWQLEALMAKTPRRADWTFKVWWTCIMVPCIDLR